MFKLKSDMQKGFTLIEMAIVIMIMGLFLAGFAALYSIYTKKAAIETTRTNISIASSAIGTFRTMNGRYPCPASLTAIRGDANYGREDCVSGTAAAIGGSNNGIFAELSTRVLPSFEFPKGTQNAPNKAPRVLVGTLPFRQLNLDEKGAYDAYGNRILYIVTEHLTCDQCFRANQGGISILNQDGTSAITPPQSGHFIVMSMGENGNGAYTAAGTQTPCSGADPDPEHENCDFNLSAADANATYQISEEDTLNDNSHYDDVMSYFTQDEMPLWQTATANPLSIHNKTSGNVGIGLSTVDQIQDKGSVGGTIKVADDPISPATQEGKVKSPMLCDGSNDGNCMPSNLIGGDLETNTGGMKCSDPAAPFMKGIIDGQPICGDIEIGCPDGRLMLGIKSNGEPDCGEEVAGKDCPRTDFEVCGPPSEVLPAASSGTVYRAYSGDAAWRDFSCNDGSWQPVDGIYGRCECTPGYEEHYEELCQAGFSGTYTRTVTEVCTHEVVDTTTDDSATACHCTPGLAYRDIECPPGFTDNDFHETAEHTCNPDGTDSWGQWTRYGSCDCHPLPDETQTVPCGNGAGMKTQTRSFDPSSCQPGPWTDLDTSQCQCQANHCPPQECQETAASQSFPCPDGFVGSVTKEARYVCDPEPGWTSWTETSNNCKPAGNQICSWQPQDAGIVQNGPSGPPKGATGCTCGSTSPAGCHLSLGGGHYKNYTTCICN